MRDIKQLIRSGAHNMPKRSELSNSEMLDLLDISKEDLQHYQDYSLHLVINSFCAGYEQGRRDTRRYYSRQNKTAIRNCRK